MRTFPRPTLTAWLPVLVSTACATSAAPAVPTHAPTHRAPSPLRERQITRGPGGRILTNIGVWSPDSRWIVYDTRSDAPGESFNGSTIEMVNVETGEKKVLFRSTRGAHCGVVTFHPREWKVAFILGPENPTPDWQYCAFHRQGVIVEVGQPGLALNLDARDLVPPFTPGALRGGSHVHVWNAPGDWVSFTYEDHVTAQFAASSPTNDVNLRSIGVSVSGRPVCVPRTHARNHDGAFFSVLVTRTTAHPKPGSDEIQRAFEEAWMGTNGYVRADGTRQPRALAFQGNVVTATGQTISEVFLVDLPEDLATAGEGPLPGTATRLPFPPKGTTQRRLTFTASSKFPGLQGPRHWLRSSPDGSHIAFLMKDDAGVVQLWTVSPNGRPPKQVTRNPWPIASAFSWSPDGRHLAHAMDNSVCLTEVATGRTRRLTERAPDAESPRSEACVFAPDGRKVAYVRRVPTEGGAANQIFVAFPES
jgi:hypothetical protein